jgi:2-oxo-4-hydroxy-4-carboxy-5-ureidoimidazoline decarboxylase
VVSRSRDQLVVPADIGEFDALDARTATAALAPLFEGAPRFLDRLVAARPFSSWDELFARARAIAHAMPEDEQVELLDAHPQLGAAPGSVSPLSYAEQGYDAAAARGAADARTAADREREQERERVARELERLNRAYEARFSFRYCVFVAGRPRAALIPGFEAALARDRETELHRALDAVVDIAASRHARGA